MASNKVPDAGLRALVEQRSTRSVSVIIELALPSPQVELREGRPRLRDTAPGERAEATTTTAAADAFLQGVLGRPAVPLRAAGAFSAEATGAQLAEISRSPLVRAIHPNRRLR